MHQNGLFDQVLVDRSYRLIIKVFLPRGYPHLSNIAEAVASFSQSDECADIKQLQKRQVLLKIKFGGCGNQTWDLSFTS